MAFELDPQLLKDTLPICDMTNCKLLLINDNRYIWTILVPKIEGATELHLLYQNTQNQIFAETMKVAKIIGEIEGIEKINIGAIGNIVRQLHIHVIGRNSSDSAWPAPVWGKGQAVPYLPENAGVLIDKIKATLGAY